MTKGYIISREVWRMLPDSCKEEMKDIKDSFLESISADVNHAIEEEIRNMIVIDECETKDLLGVLEYARNNRGQMTMSEYQLKGKLSKFYKKNYEG